MIGVSWVAMLIAASKLVLAPVLASGLGCALADMVRAAEALTVIVIEGSATVSDADDMIYLSGGGDPTILEARAAERFLTQVSRSEPLPLGGAMELAHCSHSPSQGTRRFNSAAQSIT